MLWLISTAFAGPWIHPEGEGYVRVGGQRFQAEEAIVDGRPTGLAFSSNSLTTYAEWGIGEQFQVVGSLPLVSAAHSTPEGIVFRHRWSGDLRVEVDRGLFDRPLAIGVEARFPTYKEPAHYASARGLDDDLFDAFTTSFPPLGDRNTDVTVKLMGGLGSERGWVSGEVGPTFRFGGFGHSAWTSVNAGAWVGPVALGVYGNATVMAPWLEPERATREGATVLAQAMVPVPSVPGLAVEANAGGLPWARAANRGWTAGLGLSYRRTK